jgi:hypothetical protein
MISYSARIGITVAKHSYTKSKPTEVENYIKASGLLEKYPNIIRMDVMDEDAEDARIIQGIKNLIS